MRNREDLEWSWLQEPAWLFALVFCAVVVAFMLASPLRRWAGRNVAVVCAGGILLVVGWAIGDLGEPILMFGVATFATGFVLLVGPRGSIGDLTDDLPPDHPDAVYDVDDRVAPHDIDDPATAVQGADVPDDAEPWSEVVHRLEDPVSDRMWGEPPK